MPEPRLDADAPLGFLQRGDVEGALKVMWRGIAGAHEMTAGHSQLLDLLVKLDRLDDARRLFQQAVALNCESADGFDALGFYARQLGRHDLAAEMYRQAAALAPTDGQIWYNLATSERTLGRLDGAVVACEKAVRCDPQAFQSLLLRSELTRASTTANHIDELRARLSREPTDRGQMFLAYALGKELLDLDEHDAAFSAFARGAAVRRRNLAYDVAEDERKIARIIEAYARPLKDGQCADQALGNRHIFIIGLPRSGTTLTERLLSGLAGVRSNGETDNFSKALLAHASSGVGDIFDRCANANPDAIGSAYEQRAATSGFDGAVIEKLPLNYLYAGAIARSLPAAKIIWVRRHPIDSCFAMYRTLFGEAYPFSYDFDDLSRYYAAYERLYRHWQNTLSDRILDIDYDALVKDPAAIGQRVARHCGLEWREDAVDITRNATPSLTASATQVREPIHQRSVGLWRKNQARLAPLATRLQALGVPV